MFSLLTTREPPGVAVQYNSSAWDQKSVVSGVNAPGFLPLLQDESALITQRTKKRPSYLPAARRTSSASATDVISLVRNCDPLMTSVVGVVPEEAANEARTI